MAHTYRKRPNTRLQIIQLAARLFVDDGYSVTSTKKIAKMLDISPGNVTFYFPTKDHLLMVLVDELFDFQKLVIMRSTDDGRESLLSYCLELAVMASACEDSEVTRDFYSASYKSPMTLELIREYDTARTRDIFSEFCPGWTEQQWRATENIVSGIEYATIMTTEENTPLPMQIERTLRAILRLYEVPEEMIREKIDQALSVDHREIGRRLMLEFREYIERVNEDNLKKASKIIRR